MRVLRTFWPSVALVLSTTLTHADPYSTETSLADFSDMTKYDLSNATRLSTVVDSNGVTRGVFQISPGGHIGQLSASKVSLGTNWSSYHQFYLYAVNKGTTEANLRLIIYVSGDGKNATNSWQGSAKVPADGKTYRYLLWFNTYDQAISKVGEFNFPPLDRLAANVYNKPTGPYTNIVWKIKNSDTVNTAKVELGYFKLVRSDTTLSGMVDRYGQQSNRTWGSLDGKKNELYGKVTSDAQLVSRRASELAFYETNPGPGQPFGSDHSEVPANTTGRWRTVKLPSGKYYLQAPSGKVLWSVGVNGVHDGSMTVTEGRENKFQQLPAYGSACTGMSSGKAPWETATTSRKSVSFFCLNQNIKYGESTRYSGWLEMTRKRLDYWGINTVSIDSRKELKDGSRPYVLYTNGNGFTQLIAVNSTYRTWGNPPDVFHSTYASFVGDRIQKEISTYGSSNPDAVLGMFFDNEQSFGIVKNDESEYLVPLGILRSSSTQAAKVAIIGLMQSEKGYTIQTLNSRWGESYGSFNDLLADTSHTGPGTNTLKRSDFDWILRKYLNKYYSTIKSAINSNTNFKGLYLGSRLMVNLTRPQARAAATYVDVMSLNTYRPLEGIRDQMTMIKEEMASAGREIPILFSEYAAGKNADGGVGGPNEVASAQERISVMRTFYNWAFSHPLVVGVHLYPLNDMPITGRPSDFENAKMGLVNETDTVNEDVQSVILEITKPSETTSDLFTRREAAPAPAF